MAKKNTPQPNPMSPPGGVIGYEKTRYKHLDQKLVNHQEHRIIKKLIMKAGLKDSFILNLPCGFGRFTDLFEVFHNKIVFFDLHPQMVRRCKERYQKRGHLFLNGTIRNLPFKTQSFDAILTIRFFHHYFEKEDRLAMLQELQRVTKRWIITTYYQSSFLHGIIKKINDRGNRIVMFKKEDFYKELLSVGLKPITEKSPLPFLHAQRFLLLEKI